MTLPSTPSRRSIKCHQHQTKYPYTCPPIPYHSIQPPHHKLYSKIPHQTLHNQFHFLINYHEYRILVDRLCNEPTIPLTIA
ncbi:hypothetical protein BDV35DRAFT_200013 [Aspergillus flavus]|uniref:Uncharacterized protein n=1 Tax=Aspergillus flavus TaxID=5059 RepID=A0A5N6GZE5_ASPFL|nr:hypothetical protein BDV35DRAFT_200013 [Aspergillus flavus]